MEASFLFLFYFSYLIALHLEGIPKRESGKNLTQLLFPQSNMFTHSKQVKKTLEKSNVIILTICNMDTIHKFSFCEAKIFGK